MTTTQITIYAIISLCVILVIISFSEQFKFIFNFALRASLGILAFSMINLLFAEKGFYIALNVVTVCVSGFLGFYGVMALVLSNIIL